MRTALVPLLMILPIAAHADPKPSPAVQDGTASSPPRPKQPDPGSCASLQPGVKVCAPLDGHGSWDVYAYPDVSMYIRLEEPVVSFVAPDPDAYLAERRGNEVIVWPRLESVGQLPRLSTASITTSSVTITLNFRPGAIDKADTQIIIRDPDRSAREVEIDRRVAERLAPKVAEFAEKEQHLETRAQERADAILLEELAQSGMAVDGPGGKGIARNSELIVIEAQKVIRLGKRRFVLFLVENRSARPFEVAGVKAWLSTGAGERPLALGWKFAKTTINSAEEVQGAVAVPAGTGEQILRLRIEDSHAERSVELSGIRVR